MAAGSGSAQFGLPDTRTNGESLALADLLAETWPPPERDPLFAMLDAGVLSVNEVRTIYMARATINACPPQIVPKPPVYVTSLRL